MKGLQVEPGAMMRVNWSLNARENAKAGARDGGW